MLTREENPEEDIAERWRRTVFDGPREAPDIWEERLEEDFSKVGDQITGDVRTRSLRSWRRCLQLHGENTVLLAKPEVFRRIQFDREKRILPPETSGL